MCGPSPVGANPQVGVRRWERKLLEEDVRQPAVVLCPARLSGRSMPGEALEGERQPDELRPHFHRAGTFTPAGRSSRRERCARWRRRCRLIAGSTQLGLGDERRERVPGDDRVGPPALPGQHRRLRVPAQFGQRGLHDVVVGRSVVRWASSSETSTSWTFSPGRMPVTKVSIGAVTDHRRRDLGDGGPPRPWEPRSPPGCGPVRRRRSCPPPSRSESRKRVISGSVDRDRPAVCDPGPEQLGSPTRARRARCLSGPRASSVPPLAGSPP